MTREQPGHGGRQRDPVEEFFAAHRVQVSDEPADEVTWQRIRDERRRARSGRRGAWTGALVASAAALALVVGPSLLPTADDPDVAGPGPSASEPVGPSSADDQGLPSPTAEDPTGESVPDPVVTTGQPDGALPADGRFADITTADSEPGTDSGMRYAVVMHPCETSGWCSVLADSPDGGGTWAPRADLEELGMVHRVLFTDHGRGWVWGDKAPLWTTTDGGRTWSVVDTGADYVADLSVQGDQLLATTWTYQECATGPCDLPSGSAVLTDPTDTTWTDDVAQELGPVVRAWLLDSGDVRYVLATPGDGAGVTVLRLQEGVLESTATLEECGAGPVAVTAAGGPGAGGVGWNTGLSALCDDDRGLSLRFSPNSGRTWEPANITVPSFVLGEQPPQLASVESGHLLLIGEGNYTVTTDGGQTWSDEAFLPDADAAPERLELTMFGDLIAYPTDDQASADLGYWRSEDRGLTWEVVPLHD
ncbi:sialidase family protein [Ornithinimicrobium murale]|uniref:sialidase family protein n=1 Tax=Ornithinimicrobium murale TaxID=1050153 RepID=UPI000E0D9F9C|nr:sialidase family protein [Ornithinimicrobium murale]